MKIDKQYLAQHRDKESQTCKVQIKTQWTHTSFSSVYLALDDQLEEELKGIPAIVEYEPDSYNSETKTFVLNVVLDVQDIDFEDEE